MNRFYLGKRYKEFIYSPKGYTFHITSNISEFLNEEKLSDVQEMLIYECDGLECKLLFTLDSDYIITYPSEEKWQHLESFDTTKYPIFDKIDAKNINICPTCVGMVTNESEYCNSCGDKTMNLGQQEKWNERYANSYWLGGERVYKVTNKH